MLADGDKRAAYDRFGHAGVNQGAGRASIRASSPTSATSSAAWATSSASAAGGSSRGPRRGSDLRYDLEIPFEESATGAETSHSKIPREETCETCHGSGAAAGSGPETCSQCRGLGQVRYQQGFFTVARTCGQCRGAGRIITKPCPTCRGNGRVTQSASSRSRFRPASPRASACA